MGRILLVLLQGCAGSGVGVDLSDGGGTGAVTLSQDVQPIFSANCALSGCHAPPNIQQNLNLTAGSAFANLVNVPSDELPSMRRVRPNLPDSSYLVHKIQGTQLQVGGEGARMPLGGGALSDQEISRIRTWIQQGAQDN